MQRTLIALIVLLPLLVGNEPNCPEPDYPRIEDCPFEVDPGLIEGVFLGWLRTELGREMDYTGTWCDENGDLVVLEILDGPPALTLINRSRTASYTLLWTPTRLGVQRIVIRITDKPAIALPESNVGTILLEVVPARHALGPRVCGGQPG